MQAFEWANATTVKEAVTLLTPANLKADPDDRARPFAGGQDLLTNMKAHIARPPRVVNLKTIPGLDQMVDDGKGTLRIGALVTITNLEENPLVRRHFPGLAEAAHSIATPQVRNLGTVGGNLCQRPRCWYYRLEDNTNKCLKRGGTQCFAALGENKYNAILGGGPSFIVHPSDLAPMLVALGATVSIAGFAGRRTMPLADFFTLPTEAIRRENVLKDGEIITEIGIKTPQSDATRSTYLKFKERDSMDFAMASVAAFVDFAPDRTVRTANIVLGGVAPIPWQAKDSDAYLAGKKLDEKSMAQAATLALADALPLEHNAYKIPLTHTLIRRALAKINS